MIDPAYYNMLDIESFLLMLKDPFYSDSDNGDFGH